MPEASIIKLLGAVLPDPIPQCARAELYLLVSDVDEVHACALAAGATELSPPQQRDWGHRVGYCLDPDGHVLAVARAPRARAKNLPSILPEESIHRSKPPHL